MLENIGKYMDSNNVIVFPKKNMNPNMEYSSFEEIDKNVEMMKHYHIQETIANIAPMIFNHLDVAGFDLSDEDATGIKDGAFIVESIRALLCKHHGMYHPFQLLAENVFIPDEEESGALRITEHLNLELKKSETT